MVVELDVRSQKIRLEEDGIVRAKLKPHVDVDLTDAEEAVSAIASLCQGVRRPVLVDITEVKSMTRECRVYFAGPETAKVEAAAALLIRSPLTKAIGNFFMGLNKPLFPTRLFTSESEAIGWLSSFLT